MIKEYEHLCAEMGDIYDNEELMELLNELEDKCDTIPIVDYTDIKATVYKASSKEYYVYCALEDGYGDMNAYVNRFRNKDDVIYYILDITHDTYDYLNKRIK